MVTTQTGAEEEAIEECALLACLFSGSCSAYFFIYPKFICLGLYAPQWNQLSTLVSNQVKAQTYPQTNLINTNTQTRFPLPR